jgi:GT2 family glycosyltransferase
MIPVIIPTYNNQEMLDNCVKALQNSTVQTYPLVIENNGTGFTKAVNDGLKQIPHNADHIIILNDDTELMPDCIEILLDTISKDSSIGILGTCPVKSKLLPHQPGGSIMADLLGGHTKVPRFDIPLIFSTIAVQFHGVMISKELLQTIGLLDEGFINFCSDSDYCLRAKMANFKVCYCNRALLYHKGSQSVFRVKNTMVEDQLYFIYKWLGQGVNRLLENIPLDEEFGIKGKLDLIIKGDSKNLEVFKRKFGMYS